MRNAIVLLAVSAALAAPALADGVYNGTIFRLGGTPVGGDASLGQTVSTIDRLTITVTTAGVVTFDILSWERDAFGLPFDTNGDGESAFFDSVINLYSSTTVFDASTHLGFNDDSVSSFADGSISGLDSYLSIFLTPGTYTLSVGGYGYSHAEVAAGFNPGTGNGYDPVTTDPDGYLFVNDHGDYRLTVTGADVVPAPGAAAALGLASLATLRRRRR